MFLWHITFLLRTLDTDTDWGIDGKQAMSTYYKSVHYIPENRFFHSLFLFRLSHEPLQIHIDGLAQETRNSTALSFIAPYTAGLLPRYRHNHMVASMTEK